MEKYIRNDKNVIIISSILPVISVFIVLFWRNNVTIVLYNICYVIFTSLLSLIREIRLFNLSNSYIVNKNNQSEFFAIREGMLNFGRVVSYIILLFAGLTKNQLFLNGIMILLTFFILIMGLNVSKIENFKKD